MGNNPTPLPPGPGRPKGAPNKSTTLAKAAIATFVDGNVGRLQRLLDRIEETEGPKAAWDCIVSLLEFHISKLARTEITGADGAPLQISWPLPQTKLDE